MPPVLCPHECKPRLLRARGAPFRAPSVLSIARASGLRPPAPWRLSLWLVLVPSPVVIQDACPPLLDADSLSQALARRSCLGAYRTDVFRDPLLTGASPMRACSASGSAPIIRVCSGSLPRRMTLSAASCPAHVSASSSSAVSSLPGPRCLDAMAVCWLGHSPPIGLRVCSWSPHSSWLAPLLRPPCCASSAILVRVELWSQD